MINLPNKTSVEQMLIDNEDGFDSVHVVQDSEGKKVFLVEEDNESDSYTRLVFIFNIDSENFLKYCGFVPVNLAAI